jgi:hypothetical protein
MPSTEEKYKIIVEHIDGRHTRDKGLTYEEALEKAEEWLGRSLQGFEKRDPKKTSTVVRAVADHGGVLYVERNLSEHADIMWDIVNYAMRVTYEPIKKMLDKGDEYMVSELKGMSEEDMKKGLAELEAAGFIDPSKDRGD